MVSASYDISPKASAIFAFGIGPKPKYRFWLYTIIKSLNLPTRRKGYNKERVGAQKWN